MYLGYKGPRDNLVLTELMENSDHREHLDHALGNNGTDGEVEPKVHESSRMSFKNADV